MCFFFIVIPFYRNLERRETGIGERESRKRETDTGNGKKEMRKIIKTLVCARKVSIGAFPAEVFS
jgi:hypothetical protein